VEIAEPTTTLTDYLLALAAWTWGALLLRQRVLPARLFGLAFFATGLAAAIGGSAHGFGPGWSGSARAAAWLATYGVVGLANLLLLAGAVLAWAPRLYQLTLLGLLGFRLGVYAILLASHREFRYVIYDFIGTLVALGALALLGRGARPAPVPPTLAGILVSFAGALVQSSGFALHPHFNHNDLFHVIEIAGLYCFYRAGRSFQ
jgi:hypothetical protein